MYFNSTNTCLQEEGRLASRSSLFYLWPSRSCSAMAGPSSCSWPHGFPPAVLRAVEEAGASDLSDLASLWTSRQEAVQSSADAGLTHELAARVGQLWALARCMESRPSCQATSIAQQVSRVQVAPHTQLAHPSLRMPAGPARPGVALRGPPLPLPKLRSGRVGGGVDISSRVTLSGKSACESASWQW